MAVYIVQCATLEGEHSHVTGVRTRKVLRFKQRLGKQKWFSLDKVVRKIGNEHDMFLTVAKTGASVVEVWPETCGDGCRKLVLRTRSDGSTKDNLDYLKCP